MPDCLENEDLALGACRHLAITGCLNKFNGSVVGYVLIDLDTIVIGHDGALVLSHVGTVGICVEDVAMMEWCVGDDGLVRVSLDTRPLSNTGVSVFINLKLSTLYHNRDS